MDTTMICCAACGEAGESLKFCATCKSVGYCDVNCQKKHRKKHRKECSRMALRLKAQETTSEFSARLESLSASVSADLDDPDSELWKPHSRPECPICMLPLPYDPSKSIYKMCCGNRVCGGCALKNEETLMENKVARRVNAPLEVPCVFCRVLTPSGTEELLKRTQKRMELNDPNAFFVMSRRCSEGTGVPKEEWKGFQYLIRAAELGSSKAYAYLAGHYSDGKFVAVDKGKEKALLQVAAMGGNVYARHNLGLFEIFNGQKDLAVRHWQIAAGAGMEESLSNVKEAYKEGFASKDEFAETLRAYHAAQAELKSDERERFSAARAEMMRRRGN